jgi:RNA polymerase sigma factor (sigma-70 family)
MKLDVMSNVATTNDADLVAQVLNGHRDAFGQLVARYQSSVSALAYSACGNISQSEDLAQETFIIAWRKLGELEEPAKFKGWLHGIARNTVNNTFRQQARNPLAVSDPLDESLSAAASASNPTEHAIGKEEEAILWRSLEQIPETYREPLVLYYREHQSIERVAAVLELSEEAARQRLSRGRKLLQERVAAFVEGALEQTAPGPAFTLCVLAALPAMTFSAKAATLGAAAKAGAAAKGAGLAGLFGKFLGPLFPFVGMWADYRQLKKVGLPEPALKALRRYNLAIAFGVVSMVVVVCVLMDRGAALAKTSPTFFVTLNVGLILGFFSAVGIISGRLRRVLKEAAAKESAAGNLNLAKEMGSVWEYRSRVELMGLPLIHIRRGARIAEPSWTSAVKAWIAISDNFAFGALFAYGGVAVAPVSIGACALGLVSYGGVAIGALSWGGFSFGILAFGAAAFGWEAFTGGCAIAWHLAWGDQYAIAHDYALGAGTVHAAQGNTPFVEQLAKSSWGHDFAIALTPYFYWLMWAWTIPMMVSMIAGWFRTGGHQKFTAPTSR